MTWQFCKHNCHWEAIAFYVEFENISRSTIKSRGNPNHTKTHAATIDHFTASSGFVIHL